MEYISGGRSEGMSPEDIAKKHGVPLELILEQLKRGTMVEHEHSPDDNIAGEIAKDHLAETPIYYEYLERMEAEFKKNYKKDIEKEAKDFRKEIALKRLFG